MVITIDMVTGVVNQDSTEPRRREELRGYQPEMIPPVERDLGLRIQPVEPHTVPQPFNPAILPQDLDRFLDEMSH